MYFRQPEYFGKFHCIGNACPDNCCYGWRIDWRKEEIDKLKKAEDKMSSKLKELVEMSFIPNKEIEGKFQINFNEQGRCPCLTEDGLCRIQKELGADYLSGTCMVYPRRFIATKEIIYRFCHMSCREVLTNLLNNEKAMGLINSKIDVEKISDNMIYDSPEALNKYPEKKYRAELLEFFYELMNDNKHDITTNIVLGALAAQSLTKLVEQGEIERIPEALISFKSQMHNGSQLRSIENLKPNYHLRFGLIGKLMQEIVGFNFIENLKDKTGTPNISLYCVALNRLNKIFKDRPFFLRNIALNLLLELAVPFTLENRTIFENYTLFAASFACIKLNLISVAMLEDEVKVNVLGQTFHYYGEERFAGLTAIICRGICQNTPKEQLVVDFLNKYKITSPAYIALLVK